MTELLEKNKVYVIGVVVVVLFLGLATFVANTGGSARRDEVPMNVDLIRLAEIEYKSAFEEYVSADPAPRDPLAVDAKAVPWEGTRGFDKLSWKPEAAQVYGSYAVNAKADGFTVVGVCDTDGDQSQARFQATLGEEAKMLTPENVY
ncbi:MAG: hypothetical protein KC656_09505 [Myxococcales bacterium]|nr:hypothetical protein [Myxococcales bacterium]